VYEGVQRRAQHELIERAVEHSDGRVLASSGPSSAPLFIGFEGERGERLGICAYVFLANRRQDQEPGRRMSIACKCATAMSTIRPGAAARILLASIRWRAMSRAMARLGIEPRTLRFSVVRRPV